MARVFIRLSIPNDDGASVEILRSGSFEVDSILEEGRGGTRSYIDLPDLSIYNSQKKISVDILRDKE